MFVKLGDVEYKVTWRYSVEDLNPVTECFINAVGPDGKVDIDNDFAYGVAYCSLFDNFDKNKGRKISLGRALKMVFLDRQAERLVFWQAYQKMRNGKW